MEQGTSDDGEDDGTPAAAPGSDDDDIEGTAPVRLASSCLAVCNTICELVVFACSLLSRRMIVS